MVTGEAMGEILCNRRDEEDPRRFILEILVSQEELRQLKGEMDRIILVAENGTSAPSRVSLRGKNEATKYFLIPRQLRKRLSLHGPVTCQRKDVDGKSIFVYIVSP